MPGLTLQLGFPMHFLQAELPEASSKLLTHKRTAVFEVGRDDVVTPFEGKPLGC